VSQGVRVVINVEMPRDLTTYVHRVGRTARAGRSGHAVTLTGEVSPRVWGACTRARGCVLFVWVRRGRGGWITHPYGVPAAASVSAALVSLLAADAP
jgi:hypothetical protein